METVVDSITELSSDLQHEVYDFAGFLLESKVCLKQKILHLTRAGSLRDFGDIFNLSIREK